MVKPGGKANKPASSIKSSIFNIFSLVNNQELMVWWIFNGSIRGT